MQLDETWEDRPILSDQSASFSNSVVDSICKRRPHLLEICDIVNITDTSPQYNEHYVNVANIVIKAIDDCTPIIIVGDYDVDGMAATATLYSCIKAVGATDVTWWIPSRDDGYGINAEKVIDVAHDCMFTAPLIITVDNGIAAAEEIAKLPPSFKVIVTDHHLADGKELPKCEYILNPKVFAKEEDDEYMISGCTLMTLSGFRYGSDITTNFLSFILIPKINATGRMNKVDLGMRLLLDRVDTSDNNKDSLLLANELINCNRSRKTLEDIILNEAFDLTCQIYRTDSSDELPSAIVVHKSDWATGVIGIVAARLTDIFKVPVICLTGEDVLHGSGRAPEGYDLYNGLEQCKDLLIQFGGHKVAGGLSLDKTKLVEFRNKLSEIYASQKDIKYVVHIDATATIKDIKDVTFQLFLKRAEPFGSMNEPLNIRLNNVKIINTYTKGESLYLILADNTDNILVSKYRADDEWYKLLSQEIIDIVITPNLTYFSGVTLPEYRAVSFKTHNDETSALSKVKVFTNEEEYKKHCNN